MTLDPAGLEAAAKLARSCTPTAREDARLAEQIVRAYLAAAPDTGRSVLMHVPVTPTTENPDRPEWASQFRPPRGEFIEWMDADEDSLAAIEREDHSTYVATLSVCRDNGESAGVRIYPDDARRIVGFLAPVAGGAAATPDPPKDAHRPWPIAPDTVMPPRRQPVRWGSRADDPPTEIHNDPQTTKAYLAGLAAGRTEAAASPDERLREAGLTAAAEAYADRPLCCGCDDDIETLAAMANAGDRLAEVVARVCGEGHPALAAWRSVSGSSEPR